MCINLKKHKDFYLDRSSDGHEFSIEKIRGKLYNIVVTVRGGFGYEMTKEFDNVFEMNRLCDEVVEKDKQND